LIVARYKVPGNEKSPSVPLGTLDSSPVRSAG
jgi:hypothetical protein